MSINTMPYLPKQKGFSLIEISIVLVIIGLILGGVLGPLGAQIESSRRNETQQTLSLITESLYGYTLTNGRLPCPDSSGNGAENRTGTNCTSVQGTLPWATLAVGREDAWGQTFIYRVTNSFADTIEGTGCLPTTLNISFSLCSQGDITILNQAGGATVASNIAAIIISRGKNWGNAGSADETENSNTNAIFVDKIYSAVGGNTFDDMVTWVVPGILINRMVSAGQLP